MSPILSFPCILQSNKIINGHICSSWLAAIFCKNVCFTAHAHLHDSHIYHDLPSYLSRAFSQRQLQCCLPGCSPCLPQRKLDSQLSHCAFIFPVGTSAKENGERYTVLSNFQVSQKGERENKILIYYF